MSELHCVLCGASETERPLIGARFDGVVVQFCPKCMPTLIHGLTAQELQGILKEKAGPRA